MNSVSLIVGDCRHDNGSLTPLGDAARRKIATMSRRFFEEQRKKSIRIRETPFPGGYEKHRLPSAVAVEQAVFLVFFENNG